MTQLTAQSSATRETVSFSGLLAECLSMNKVAIQTNCRTAWQYDQEKWSQVHERAQRYEIKLEVESTLTDLSRSEVTRIREEVQKRFAQEQKSNSKRKEDRAGDDTPQESDAHYKGRGKDRGFVPLKAQFPSSSSSWQDEPPNKKQFKGKGGGAFRQKKNWGKSQEMKEEQ